MNKFAESQQAQRDLRAQLSEISKDDQGDQEMQFIEWSPGRKMQRLWSMQDGTQIDIPRYMVGGAIVKRLADGRFAFTANQSEAPVFKDGNVSCFLAKGSTERESGLLEAAGLDHLALCPAEHLRSAYSKRMHALNRHPQSYAALQEHIQETERTEARDEQRRQTQAMLQLANAGQQSSPQEGKVKANG